MLSKKAAEVGAAFQRYVKYSDKSEIEGIEIDELEEALIHFSRDKSMPFYNAMERQLERLKEEERRRRNEEEDMFGSILLEPEQEKLLYVLVEAARNVPSEKRGKFLVLDTDTGMAVITHLGSPDYRLPAYKGDVEALADENLLRTSYGSGGSMRFDVSPLGFKYYEYLKQRRGQPVQEITRTIQQYLNAEQFQRNYSEAYSKWVDAEMKLWESDSEKQLTTIGHLCREAMQAFITALVAKYQPSNVNKNPANTAARLRTILDIKSDQLGATIKPFLEALLAYWGTLSDLVQRQEHGAQKEGEPLVWEDGRRVVFQTAVVMFEIDKSLSRIR